MAGESWKDITDSLGLPETATEDEVRKAFKAFARTDHPDVNPNSARGEEFSRASSLFSLMNQGKLYPGSQSIESAEEEDVFADVTAQKEKIKKEAEPVYKPVDGKNITIERTIDADLAENGGKLSIPIVGTALLASKLVREKSIEIEIKPKSWGRHQIVLSGKGRPGLFGGKSGNLIISIKSEPLKAPIRPQPTPQPTPRPNSSKKRNRETSKDSEKLVKLTKIRPSVLPKPEFPPKPYPTQIKVDKNNIEGRSQEGESVPNNEKAKKSWKSLRYTIVSLIFLFYLGNIISNNTDLRNSDDATFQICDATNSLHASIFFDKFYNYENPYKAAIYFNYFTEDIDASDEVSEIDVQYPRIQAEKFANIKAISEELSYAFSLNDNSIIPAMNQMKDECAAQGYPWNE